MSKKKQVSVKLGFKKVALNLSAFLLLLSSIAMLDRGSWAWAGTLGFVLAILLGVYSFWKYYFQWKFPLPITEKMIFFLASIALVLLSLYQFFAINWQLGFIFCLCSIFVVLVFAQLLGKTKFLPAD